MINIYDGFELLHTDEDYTGLLKKFKAFAAEYGGGDDYSNDDRYVKDMFIKSSAIAIMRTTDEFAGYIKNSLFISIAIFSLYRKFDVENKEIIVHSFSLQKTKFYQVVDINQTVSKIFGWAIDVSTEKNKNSATIRFEYDYDSNSFNRLCTNDKDYLLNEVKAYVSRYNMSADNQSEPVMYQISDLNNTNILKEILERDELARAK